MATKRQTASTRVRYGKWAGLLLGMAAAAADQQIVSTTVFARCPENSEAFALGVGATCLIVAIVGGVLSWSVRQRTPEEPNASHTRLTDHFIATLSALFALLSALVIVFGTTAGLVLQCERF